MLETSSSFRTKNNSLKSFLSFLQKQPSEVFYKKAVLKNFAIFRGKYLCWILFLIKLSGLGLHITAKFLRTSILKNFYERLLLFLLRSLFFAVGIHFTYRHHYKQQIFRSSYRRRSVKKVLLKISQISQDNTCVGVSF